MTTRYALNRNTGIANYPKQIHKKMNLEIWVQPLFINEYPLNPPIIQIIQNIAHSLNTLFIITLV